MFILVLGPNGSGKSRYAEKLIAHLTPDGAPRVYIATMIPYGEEGAERVARHRRQREALSFTTCELPRTVSDAPVARNGAALLEDVSNLTANILFDGERPGSAETAVREVLRLRSRAAILVAVTIDGLTPNGCNAETRSYINALSEVNRRLLDRADAAVRLSDGVPEWIKGDGYALV